MYRVPLVYGETAWQQQRLFERIVFECAPYQTDVLHLIKHSTVARSQHHQRQKPTRERAQVINIARGSDSFVCFWVYISMAATNVIPSPADMYLVRKLNLWSPWPPFPTLKCHIFDVVWVSHSIRRFRQNNYEELSRRCVPIDRRPTWCKSAQE